MADSSYSIRDDRQRWWDVDRVPLGLAKCSVLKKLETRVRDTGSAELAGASSYSDAAHTISDAAPTFDTLL